MNKKTKIVLIFITILIFGLGFFFISRGFDDGLGELDYGTKEQYLEFRYEGGVDDILETSDLHGRITSYPAVAEIKWSSTSGWIPATQYFTFENLKDIPIDNVRIATRFSGELRKAKLWEQVAVEKFMPNGSYIEINVIGSHPNSSDEVEKISHSTYRSYYENEWISRTPSSTEVNGKHIYYAIIDFEANEEKVFKVEYLPAIDDMSGKWDVVAFTGNPSNPDYSIVLDPYFNYGGSLGWGDGVHTNTEDTTNLTLVAGETLGYFLSNGKGDGISTFTNWQITTTGEFNYSQNDNNGTYYYLPFENISTGYDDGGISTVNWQDSSTGEPNYSSYPNGVIGRYLGMNGDYQVNHRGIRRNESDDDNLENADIQMCMWIYPTDCSGASDSCQLYVHSRNAGGSGTSSLQFNIDNIEMSIDGDGGYTTGVQTIGDITGSWNFVCYQIGTKTNDMFLNGDKIYDGSSTDVLPSFDGSAGENYICATHNYAGQIACDGFRLYTNNSGSALLTEKGIREIYKKEAHKYKIQTSYSSDNSTWNGYFNWTNTTVSGNIVGSSKYVQFQAFLESVNGSSTPYLNYVNLSYTLPTSLGTYNVLDNLILNSTEGTNYTNEDLYLSFIPVNNNTITPLFGNISFYNHSIFHSVYQNIPITNNTYYQFTFDSINTSKNDIWYAEINWSDNDGTNNATSINLTIRNTAPTTPTINLPNDGITTINYTMNLSCYGSTDIDGDDIRYDFFADLGITPPTTLVGNQTAQSKIYNLGNEGTYYWKCRANDTDDSSGDTAIRSFIVDRRYIYDASITSNPTSIEGTSETFKINISYSNELVNTISSIFKYNTTEYSTIPLIETPNRTSLSVTINLPTSTVNNQINNFLFNISLLLHNGTIVRNESYTGTQTVNNIHLSNCDATNSSSLFIMNFTFRLENEKNTTNGEYVRFNNTAEGYLVYSATNANLTRQLDIYEPDNITEFGVCITPKDTNVLITDGVISYNDKYDVNYDKRYYYFRQDTLYNNTVRNISLYSLPKTSGIPISFTVKNSIGELVNDYIIESHKHDIADNTYHLVAMGKTGLDGVGLIYLKQGDTPYKFLIRDTDGDYVEPFEALISVASKILDKATYTINLGAGFTVGDLLEYLANIQTGLSFNNDTSTFIYSYNDTEARTERTVLKITRLTGTQTTTLVDETFLGNTALKTYIVDNTTGIYVATVYVVDEEGNTQYILQSSRTFDLPDMTDLVGSEGLLATMFIFLTYVFMATTNPVATLIFAVVALIFAFMLGIFNIGFFTLITFIILAGGVIFYKLHK